MVTSQLAIISIFYEKRKKKRKNNQKEKKDKIITVFEAWYYYENTNQTGVKMLKPKTDLDRNKYNLTFMIPSRYVT